MFYVYFRHGDLLYLAEKPSEAPTGSTAVAEEDEVDKLLAQKDARIERSRDPQLYVIDGHIICGCNSFHTLAAATMVHRDDASTVPH